jgi:hypothetical protein
MVDRKGTVWFLSFKGLCKWDRGEDYFKYSELQVTHNDNSGYYDVSDILFDKRSKRNIIATRSADGLHVFDSIGQETIIPCDFDPSNKHNQTINDLMQDRLGNIWVVSRDFVFQLSTDNRLIKIDAVNKLTKYPFFYKALQSDNGDLWITGSRGGLFHKVFNSNKWERIETSTDFMTSNNRTLDLLEDGNHRIWLQNSKSGIDIYDLERKVWSHFRHDDQDPNSLISDLTTDFAKTPKGDIFVSTASGISKFDPTNNNFLTKNRALGLIASLASDKEGLLWAITGGGLLRIDPLTFNYETFSAVDGLKGTFASLEVESGEDGKMYVFLNRGFYEFDPSDFKKKEIEAPIVITSIKNLHTSETFLNPPSRLLTNYQSNSITIEFAALNFLSPLKNHYEYKMEGLNNQWIKTTNHAVTYSGIPSGNFTFKVHLTGENSNSKEASIEISVTAPFWRQDWFRMLITSVVLGLAYLAFRMRLNQVRKEEKIKREYNKKIADVEMKALRAQMNPHFIFNSLNSINRYIIKSEPEKAALYLTKFSKLIRLILDRSNFKIVSLSNEINALKLYIDLEALRFNGKFSYSINLNGGIDPETVGVPPMIIQPYVENAIWHGLLHKDSFGNLDISFEKETVGIKCVIVDNGIGRKRAEELNSKSVNKEKSFGMKITHERLNLLSEESAASFVDIVDLTDNLGNSLGTKVIIKILSTSLEPEYQI